MQKGAKARWPEPPYPAQGVGVATGGFSRTPRPRGAGFRTRTTTRTMGSVIAFIDIGGPKPHFQRADFYDLFIIAL